MQLVYQLCTVSTDFTQVNVYVHSVYKLCTVSTDYTYTRIRRVYAYTCIRVYVRICEYMIYYYTPLPVNLANNKQATCKQPTNRQHFSFPFWPLLRSTALGSTLL